MTERIVDKHACGTKQTDWLRTCIEPLAGGRINCQLMAGGQDELLTDVDVQERAVPRSFCKVALSSIMGRHEQMPVIRWSDSVQEPISSSPSSESFLSTHLSG